MCHKDTHEHSFGIYFIYFAICFGFILISPGLNRLYTFVAMCYTVRRSITDVYLEY